MGNVIHFLYSENFKMFGNPRKYSSFHLTQQLHLPVWLAVKEFRCQNITHLRDPFEKSQSKVESEGRGELGTSVKSPVFPEAMAALCFPGPSPRGLHPCELPAIGQTIHPLCCLQSLFLLLRNADKTAHHRHPGAAAFIILTDSHFMLGGLSTSNIIHMLVLPLAPWRRGYQRLHFIDGQIKAEKEPAEASQGSGSEAAGFSALLCRLGSLTKGGPPTLNEQAFKIVSLVPKEVITPGGTAGSQVQPWWGSRLPFWRWKWRWERGSQDQTDCKAPLRRPQDRRSPGKLRVGPGHAHPPAILQAPRATSPVRGP